MLGVSLPTLRYWEQEVEQLRPRTNAGRTRFYSHDDIALLRRILHLRDMHVPVKEWSQRLKLDNRVLDKQMAMKQNLESIRAQLVALRDLI